MSSLRGKMLVAMPDMQDPFFQQSLILICEHDEEYGALGFVLNHPSNLTMRDLLRNVDMKPQDHANAERPVFVGGPVQQRRGFGLFLPDNPEDQYPSFHEVENGIRVTASCHLLKLCAEGTEPKDLLFVLGYSGWREGQLEKEIRNGHWWEIRANPDIMFHVPPKDRWGRAVEEMDIDHTAIFPGCGHG